MGAYASIAEALHVVSHLRDSLPPGSLIIIVPLLLSLILPRRPRSQEPSHPPSPMPSCTFVIPFRVDVRRTRRRTERDAPISRPPSLEPGWRRLSVPEPDPEFPFLVGCSRTANAASLTSAYMEEIDDSRMTQRCPLHKLDRFRPRRHKKEPAQARSSETHGPRERRAEKRPHSAPARERLASYGGVERSASRSGDAGGNGFVGRQSLQEVSASQESVEVARRLHDDDDDDYALTSNLSWCSFDGSEDSQRSGRPNSVLWEARKSHVPKLKSAVLSEPHADAESDAQGVSGLLLGERCTPVDEEPEFGATTEITGDGPFGELLQLCGQEKAATFGDILQDLEVQKCLKLREGEGEEVFRVDADRGGGTALLTVLHGDYVIRRWKHSLDDIMARTGSCYCVRDKYSEVLEKACINYFNLKGCTKFGEDERRMIRPYIVVLKPIPGVTSSYF